MKFTVEIELGNDAMQTSKDVREAIFDSLTKGQVFTSPDVHPIRDLNGNKVGSWEIK